MSYIGSYKVDDPLTFVVNTQVFATGVATDADSPPAYRVYEDETGTAILTGSMALLDSSNTAGFYSEQITLSTANGFEKGKCYSIYISATVSSVAGATHRTFQMQAEVAVASVNTAAGVEIADAVLDRDMSTGTDSGSTTVRTPRQALRFLRNKWSLSGTTLTVTKENDSTASWTSTISSTPGADPITANDPAGP